MKNSFFNYYYYYYYYYYYHHHHHNVDLASITVNLAQMAQHVAHSSYL